MKPSDGVRLFKMLGSPCGFLYRDLLASENVEFSESPHLMRCFSTFDLLYSYRFPSALDRFISRLANCFSKDQ